MTVPGSDLQLINLFAALLLLLAFAMLSQRRIVSLIHLFAAAGRGAVRCRRASSPTRRASRICTCRPR